MKMETEALEELAQKYAEAHEATKNSSSSVHVAFTLLNETEKMMHAHDEEDLHVLTDLLQKLGVGTERELQKKAWGMVIKKGMERPVIVMEESRPLWYQTGSMA